MSLNSSKNNFRNHVQATDLLKQGKLEEAESLYKKILQRDSSFINAHNNLGVLYRLQGKLDLAEEQYRKTIQLNPSYFQGYSNLGNVFRLQGKLQEAEASYRTALRLNPDFADAYNSLGATLQLSGNLEEAAQNYEQAIKIHPGNLDAYGNLGGVLLMLGRIDEAEACLRAVEGSDNAPEPLYNLANLLKEKTQLYEAAKLYQRVIEQQATFTDAYNGLLECLRGLCAWQQIEEISAKLRDLTKKEIAQGKRTGQTPFTSIAISHDPITNLAIAKSWSTYIKKRADPEFSFHRGTKAHRKIRIGYVSRDFTDHPVGHIIKTLFKKHDKRKFEVYCFSFGGKRTDRFRQQIEKSVKHFVDITSLGYLDAAKKIRAEEIDILIDLMGHTNANRLEIFAFRPSPIQISYLGFPGSIGADFIDYQIVDKIIVPEGVEKYYAEKLIFMPNCYQVNDQWQQISRKKCTRSDFGIPQDAFVFCGFNRVSKITRELFRSWVNILHAVPGSVLWLQAGDPVAEENIRNEAEKGGIEPKRIFFSKIIPLEQHLKRLPLADLMLDTFPYSGGATTSHALRMGVPVLTLSGKTYISRMSTSLLHAVGMEKELVTRSFEEYESLAIRLARYPKKLQSIRGKLIGNTASSTLFQTTLFAAHLEQAYKKVWEDYKSAKISNTFFV